MRTGLLVGALGVLLVLAGCSALPTDPGDAGPTVTDSSDTVAPTTPKPDGAEGSTRTATASETTPEPASEVSRTETRTETRTVRETSSGSADAVERVDNPWGERTVTVALVPNGHTETDYEASLRGALEYWDGHMALADYQVEFEVVDGDPAEADIRVEIRDAVGSCGYDQGESLVGCAPLIERGVTPDRPATVRIEAGFNQRSTRSVMIHEFGHVLGLEHGEPPEVYMTANNTLFTVEQPDATERAYPWDTDQFGVYVATDDLSADERADTRTQVRHAIEYYNRVRDVDPAVPSNVSLFLVDDPAAANVVVSFPEDLPCGASEGSCGGRFGPELDGDGRIEYYNRLNVTISGVGTEARGWHVGYWFGRSLGLGDAELPAPFVDPSYREIRSDWWTEEP